MSATAALPTRRRVPLPWLAGVRADILALLALLSGLVPALLPLAAEGVPATHDGFLHLQRLVALDALLREGATSLRWLPGLAYGYGQPVFNYYAPLAYAPAVAARLAGLSFGAAFELATALALVGSAAAAYALGRALFGPVAALTAALVYANLPYQLVDVYVRGALAETWAFAWLPLVALCLVRARTDGRARWPVGLGLSVAGLVLTHNITALLAAPAMAALALALWAGRGPHGRLALAPGWRRPLLGGLVGLGLAAPFWLPAILERDLVQLGETIEPALFSSFFVRQWPPFRLDPAYDYAEPVSMALGSPIFWPQLGLVQAVVTLGGALAAARARGPARRVLLWAAGLAAACFLLQLGPAEGLYGLVPLASFVQFPWRLLALLGLGSALLAGALVASVGRHDLARLAVGALVVGASIWTAVDRLAPLPSFPDDRYLTRDSILRAELADHGLGTTHSGEYLPVSSGMRNAARFRRALLDEPSGRASAAPLPDDVRIADLRSSPGGLAFAVTTARPERILVHRFAFPGLAATIDGRAAPVQAAGRFGAAAVDVPAGTSRIELRWDWTPARLVGALLGAGAAVGLLMLAGLGPLRGAIVVVLGGALAAAGALAPTVLGGRSGESDGPRWQPIDDRLAVVRADLDRSRLARDGVVTADVTWLARAPLGGGYSATAIVEGRGGAVHRAPWAYDALARHWERGEVVETTTAVRLPAGFPNGLATVALLVRRRDGGEPVRIEIGRVEVPLRNAARESRSRLPAVAGVVLVDRHLATPSGRWHEIRPGDWLDADLTLAAATTDEPRRQDLYAQLVLRAPGADVASDPQRIGDWFQPLPFWQAGDSWRQVVRLASPRDLPPGDYEATLRLYGRDLAAGGLAAPGAAAWRPRGRPVAEVELGNVTVRP